LKSSSRNSSPPDTKRSNKCVAQLAFVEFFHFSRPAGPLLFSEKVMLTSAGVFSKR